jgi:pilus assembly protein CpaB
MRNRIFAVLAIAILAGGGLAYGTYNLMQNQPVKTVATPTTPVVVASADLAIGSEIKQEDLQVVSFPAGQALEGAFAKPADIVGRGLIVPVVKNEPILEAKLAPKEAGAGLPPVIPEGMRAVSVRVNEVVGVAGYVLPGTRVDVVATASPTNQPGDTTSKVVLANVQVLTAGTRMEQDQKDGKPMQVTVVTMLVTPEQAERLALASTEGKIQLALRNPLDQGAPVTPGIKPAVLMGAVRGPMPQQRAATGSSTSGASKNKPGQPVTMESYAPAMPTVEIIRGDKRNTEVIK